MTRRYAGLASRGAALVLDLVLLAVLVAGTSWLAQQLVLLDPQRCPPAQAWWQLRRHLCQFIPYVAPVVGLVFSPLYRVGFWTITGQTPGMALLGLRVLRADGGKVGLLVALKRFIGLVLSASTLGIGFLMVLVTERRRALHDLLAGTVVVYDWGTGVRAPHSRFRPLSAEARR